MSYEHVRGGGISGSVRSRAYECESKNLRDTKEDNRGLGGKRKGCNKKKQTKDGLTYSKRGHLVNHGRQGRDNGGHCLDDPTVDANDDPGGNTCPRVVQKECHAPCT